MTCGGADELLDKGMAMANVRLFQEDDTAYLRWLRDHPQGFVVNATRGLAPRYMVLHRADCRSISEYYGAARPGGFTERDYVKAASISIDALSRWVAGHGRADGSFSSVCPLCRPL